MGDPSDVPGPKLPSIVGEDEERADTKLHSFLRTPSERKPYLIHVAGPAAGERLKIGEEPLTIGRGANCVVRIQDEGVSRQHACVRATGKGSFVIEDRGSANGTFVNGHRIERTTELHNGDKIELSPSTVLKFALHDELDERYEQRLRELRTQRNSAPPLSPWSPDTWQQQPNAPPSVYEPAALAAAIAKLRRLPPIVTSWEVDELKRLLAEAQEGRQFLLQGGDSVETHDDCDVPAITNKLKVLIQMSLVLIRGCGRPVIRVGRFAGQYAAPFTAPTERRNGVELPSFGGALVNQPEFSPRARTPDSSLLVDGYFHAAATMNFVRVLCSGGFADLRKPEYFDLTYFEHAGLPPDVRAKYERMCREMTDGQFLHGMGDRAVDELMKVTFYASHEGLNLSYESAQTRRRPQREGFYNLSTHLPSIEEQNARVDGAHVEFFRGVVNPVAVMLGPTATAASTIALCDTLNPPNEPGKIVLVTRFGTKAASTQLASLVAGVRDSQRKVLWVTDPLSGNTRVSANGTKIRLFDDILRELEISTEVHRTTGTHLGGVHFEVTGADVTECVRSDSSTTDPAPYGNPRLNYRQALELAFSLVGPSRSQSGPVARARA